MEADCGCSDHEHNLNYIDGTWQLANKPKMSLDIDMERIFKQIFDREDIVLDQELWQKTFSKYAAGIGEGFGKIEYRDNRADILRKMKKNVATFAAFKNHSQINAMVDALADPKTGKLRNWSQFKIAAHKIDKIYNESWLQAEYDTAVQSARMARKWSDYERDADVYPYLRYETQGDARVRPEHQLLDGVIKRIDDPFWDKYYPPNGWRCRCDVVQERSDKDSKMFLEPSDKEVKPEFRRNTGKTGEVLNESAFIKGLSNEIQKHVRLAFTKASLTNEDSYTPIASSIKTKKSIKVHFDVRENEINQNLRTAELLTDQGFEVKMLPEYGEPKGVKWVDFMLNDEIILEYKEKTFSPNNPKGSQNQLLKKARTDQLKKSVLNHLDGFVIVKSIGYSDDMIERFLQRYWGTSERNKIFIIHNDKLEIKHKK